MCGDRIAVQRHIINRDMNDKCDAFLSLIHPLADLPVLVSPHVSIASISPINLHTNKYSRLCLLCPVARTEGNIEMIIILKKLNNKTETFKWRLTVSC